MYITRSRIRPAPATERARWHEAALVLIGHGSEVESGGNRALLRHAGVIDRLRLFAEVRAAALHGDLRPERALAGLSASEVYVAPLFMCDGELTRTVIPERLQFLLREEGRRVRLCPPVGIEPGIADLVACRARSLMREAGVDGAEASLLVVAHGSSRSPASRRATAAQAARLRECHGFARVATAYLDESPRVSDALAELRGPVVAAGLLAADDIHGGGDVPRLLAAYRHGRMYYLGAIGLDSKIPCLVLRQVAATDPFAR